MSYFDVPATMRPIARVLKDWATKAFRSTILGGAVKGLKAQPTSDGAGDRKAARKLFGGVTVPQARKIQQAFKTSDLGRFVESIHRYAKDDSRSVKQFLESLGSMGKLVSIIIGQTPNQSKPTGKSVPTDLRVALDFIGAFADQPAVLEALQKILEGKGAKVEWQPGASPAERRAARKESREHNKSVRGLNKLAEREQRAEDAIERRLERRSTVDLEMHSGFNGLGRKTRRFQKDHPIVTGDMVETPQSSNVHSFGYDIDAHTLYIRFKDRSKEKPRPQAPGPIYAYYNCPPELFLKMYRAPSKGKFIWDRLRVRGTVSGHQVDYSLVGVQNKYVPRKATYTPLGEAYVPRTVFTDTNERLESQFGRQLVRAFHRGTPNRGKPRGPNRGGPNRG